MAAATSRELILGGVESEEGEYPWVVRIGRPAFPDCPQDRPTSCGGALIRRDLVITAGMCARLDGVLSVFA
ncbi:MAG: trypsin-like serine protease [Myxococcota bacterium]